MTLRAKTARGFAFESAKTVTLLLIATAKLAVVARLLNPQAFGLFALALALLTGVETLTQIGSDRYLIQKKTLVPGLVGCVWLFGIFRGSLICIVTILLAPLYAGLSHQPAAADILYVVAFASLARGFKSPGSFLAERDINYLKVGTYEVCVAVFDAAVIIGLTVLFRNARALALGMLCSAVVEALLSYALFGVRFEAKFNWQAFAELISVGKHFMVIGVCSYIMLQGDNLTVAALLGTTMLGYYVIAYKLVDLPLRITFQITNRVAFSALSRLQTDQRRMAKAFLELLDLQVTVLLPLIAFIVLVPRTVVTGLYGSHWQQSIVVVRALGLIMLGRGMTNIVVPFLMARGDYRYISKIKVLETVAFLIGVIVGCKIYGLVGVAIGGGIGFAVALAMRLRYIIKIGNIDLNRLLESLTPVVTALLLPALAVIICERFLNMPAVAQLAVSGIVFFGLYLVITYFGRRDFVRRITDTLDVFRRPLPMTAAASGVSQQERELV
jgi:lipopolysaccharide exporter